MESLTVLKGIRRPGRLSGLKWIAGIFTLFLAASTQAAAPAKVLVVPFEPVGPADKQWIAKAVQQNLVAELGRINSLQAVTSDKPLPDKPAALKAAADAGADYVVFGTYHVNDADLRITGQVLDVAKSQTIAGLKATGTQRDLFGLEDLIAIQVRKSLPQPIVVQPEMLQQPPAIAAAPGPFAQPDRLADLNRALDRVNDLEDRINRAADRLRNLEIPVYNYDDSRPLSYTVGPYPYGYYPSYGYGYGYGWGQNNVAIIGSWNGHHSHGHFNVGAGTGAWAGAVPDGRNYSVPTGNYAVHPGNYIKPVR